MSQVQISDKFDNRLGLMHYTVSLSDNPDEPYIDDYFTDYMGASTWPRIGFPTDKPLFFHVNYFNKREEYEYQRFDVPADFVHDVVISLARTPLVRLNGASQYFFNKFIKGESGFLDYQLFLQGKMDQLQSVLKQSLKLGSNARRNFFMTHYTGIAGGNGEFNPDEYGNDFFDRLPSFLDIYQEYGIYLYASVFPDNGVISDWNQLNKQQSHWYRLGEVAKNHPAFGMLELTNEIDAHGFNWVDNKQFNPIPGVLCCSGSMGDTGADPMPDPQWDFCDHHTNRNRYPNRVVDECKANHPSRLHGKRMVSGEPIGIGNPNDNPNRTDNVQEAKERACGRTTCAGMFVHSTNGGFSRLYDNHEMPCIEAWFNEMNKPA